MLVSVERNLLDLPNTVDFEWVYYESISIFLGSELLKLYSNLLVAPKFFVDENPAPKFSKLLAPVKYP